MMPYHLHLHLRLRSLFKQISTLGVRVTTPAYSSELSHQMYNQIDELLSTVHGQQETKSCLNFVLSLILEHIRLIWLTA